MEEKRAFFRLVPIRIRTVLQESDPDPVSLKDWIRISSTRIRNPASKVYFFFTFLGEKVAIHITMDKIE